VILLAERVRVASGWLPADIASCGRLPRRSGAAPDAVGTTRAGTPWR